MVKNTFSVSDAFGETNYVVELESQVAQLTQEVERLRSAPTETQEMKEKLEELRSLASVTGGGIQQVEVSKICRNPNQPRQTFPTESLQALALSIQEDGQQQPVIIIDNEDGSYLLFDGERRWRAIQLLERETIAAVVIARPDKELHRQVLIANLHRENLNGLDMAEAIIKELNAATGLETKQITTALHTGLTRLRRYGQHAELVDLIAQPLGVQRSKLEQMELKPNEKEIIAILLSLRLNPYSVNAKTFKTLEFPEDLKKAIRDGLPTTHAQELARLKGTLFSSEKEAVKIRRKCVKEVLTQRLAVPETKKLVNSYLPQKSKPVPDALVFAQKISVEGLTAKEKESLIQVLKQKLEQLEN